MFDFERLCYPRPKPDDHLADAPYGSDDLQDAALAIERVLAAAHERGCVDAVPVLAMVSSLLREIARR